MIWLAWRGIAHSRAVADPPPVPSLLARNIVSAASRTTGAIAPGELVFLFPSGAGPRTIAGGDAGSDGKTPTLAGQTRVLFGGIPAPIIYAAEKQIAAVVPYEVQGAARTQVVVEYRGSKSVPVSVPVSATAPALFTRDQSGKGQASMLNQTGCCNSELNPALPGSVAILFATGAGQTNPPGINGYLVPIGKVSGYAVPRQAVRVTVGGKAAEVLYAGAAPNFVAGVLQVNFRIPRDAPSGDAIPLVLTVGNASSPDNVTMALRPARQRVLVIAGDAAVRDQYTRILSDEKYDVRTATDDATALRQATGPVDMVISDLAGTGGGMLARLQTLHAIQGKGPQIRITAVAAALTPQALRTADLLGAQFVFTPTLNRVAVVARLKQLLRPPAIQLSAPVDGTEQSLGLPGFRTPPR